MNLALKAVMNGDEILNTFDHVTLDYATIGPLYLYSFIALFMYVVLNVFIAILEEAYFATTCSKRAVEVFADNAT